MIPLRVLLFTDADVFAGTERHMLDLAQELASQGVLPTIACPHPAPLAERATATGLPTLSIAKRGLVDWPAVRLLRRQLKAGKFDIIHAHNGRTHLAAAIAVTLARRGRCVFTQHFIEPGHTRGHGPKARLFGLVHGWVNRHTDQFIAISDVVGRAMLKRGDAPSERTAIIWNGIPDPLLQSAIRNVDPTQVRGPFSVSPLAPLVVCAARLEAEKDVSRLIEAFAAVYQAHPTAHCLIAGEGSLRGELQRQIEELKLSGQVQLVGFVPDVLALMRSADVFVLPSLNEPFGLVLIEAMALEKPVVAINSGGACEILIDQETGLLIPPSTTEALSQALITLLRGPSQAHKFGLAGRKRFLSFFTSQRMAEKTVAVYHAALSATPSRFST